MHCKNLAILALAGCLVLMPSFKNGGNGGGFTPSPGTALAQDQNEFEKEFWLFGGLNVYGGLGLNQDTGLLIQTIDGIIEAYEKKLNQFQKYFETDQLLNVDLLILAPTKMNTDYVSSSIEVTNRLREEYPGITISFNMRPTDEYTDETFIERYTEVLERINLGVIGDKSNVRVSLDLEKWFVDGHRVTSAETMRELERIAVEEFGLQGFSSLFEVITIKEPSNNIDDDLENNESGQLSKTEVIDDEIPPEIPAHSWNFINRKIATIALISILTISTGVRPILDKQGTKALLSRVPACFAIGSAAEDLWESGNK
ncbi:MAG: hypothetical protein Q9M91_05080 [Candidatus Dojkabacteria bacterium]|nr:hypothetical protein [Candidatus Dojkabacteria bacterium]MDQ7021179.1 hypothetical protein [Candidatus Dojkabacteria bacterium]